MSENPKKIRAPRSRYPTKESILTEIKRRDREGVALNSNAIQKGAFRDVALYLAASRLFGNWGNAIEAAGLDYRKISRKPSSPYRDKASVILEIKRRKRKKQPINTSALKEGEFRDYGLYSHGRKFFGSWGNAIEAAGLDYRKINRKPSSPYQTKQTVLEEIKHRKKKGLPLCYSGIKRDAASLYRQGRKLFGNWGNAIEAAGLDYRKINRKPSSPYRDKASVILEIKRRKRKKQPLDAKALNEGEFRDYNLYSHGRKFFGSWGNAIEAAGLDYRKIAKYPPSSYQTKKAFIVEIKRRKKNRLPLNFSEIKTGAFRDTGLYPAGRKLFGSWKNAIEAAGLDYQKSCLVPQSPYPTKEAVIDEIKRRKKEKLPLYSNYLRKKSSKTKALLQSGHRFFRSWGNAIEAAGLDHRKISRKPPSPYQTKEAVIKEIRRRKEKGLAINAKALEKGEGRDLALQGKAATLFGNWTRALTAAGFDYLEITLKPPAHYPTPESVIKEIRRRKKQNLPLNAGALQKSELFGERCLHASGRGFFGNWGNAIEAAGFDYGDIKFRGRYPTKKAVVHEILKRVREGLPLTASSLQYSEYRDGTLYSTGKRKFGRWVYALLAAWEKASEPNRIAIRSILENYILREIKRRGEKGLSLVADELLKSSEEEAALVSASRKIFGNWPAALRASDVAWDGKGIAKFARPR